MTARRYQRRRKFPIVGDRVGECSGGPNWRMGRVIKSIDDWLLVKFDDGLEKAVRKSYFASTDFWRIFPKKPG